MREKWQITKHNRLGATGKALNRKDKLAFNHDLQDATFRTKNHFMTLFGLSTVLRVTPSKV